MKTVLAGDLGGTNFRGAVVGADGKVRAVRSVKVPYPATPRAVLGAIEGVFRALIEEGARPASLCLSFKGLVDPEKAVSNLISDFTDWDDVPVGKVLKKAFKRPVLLENDAKCAALGEGWMGRARGVDDYVFVIVGTGIGTGIVEGGRLRRGAHGHAGELGHTILDASNREFSCGCGQYGDLESLAAGPSLALRAKRALDAGDPGLAAFRAGRPGPVDGLFVSEALKAGVPAARRILEEAGTWLGLGLYNLVRAFDPELIVLGGGVSSLGTELSEPARKECARRLSAFGLVPPPIKVSSLGDRAGLLGAASLAFRPLR